MIKIGDRVKFISDTSVGVVISIKGSIATVAVEDGFEIPAMLSDLVVVAQEDEDETIKRMGIGDGTPVGKRGGKRKSENEERKRTIMRGISQYGKVVLEDDFVDEDED